MDRKFVISFAIVLILLWFAGFVVHGVLLANDYAQLPNLMRPQDSFHTLWPFMLLARIFQSFAFCYIYIKGMEDKPWLPQGLRFGMLMALLLTVPAYLIYYVVMPIPPALVVKQIVFDSVVMVALGAVVAWVNR